MREFGGLKSPHSFPMYGEGRDMESGMWLPS